MSFRSLPEMFFSRAAGFGTRPRYRAKRDGRWVEISWEGCALSVREIAAGLCALGVRPGDRVALVSNTRPEWVEIDLAILAVGAVTIPIYQSVLAEECGYILWDSGARVVFAEDAAQVAKVRRVTERGIDLDGGHAPVEVHHLVVMSPGGSNGGAGALDLAALRAEGRTQLDRLGAEIDRRTGALERRDVATIVYTSGTTGPPKGVVQSHGNHLAALEAMAPLGLAREGDVDLLFLPLAHSFARMLEYLGLYVGTVTAFASVDTLARDMAEASPDYVPAVPRVFEKVFGRIMTTRDAGGTLKRTLFDAAVAVGRRWSACVQSGRPVPAPLQALHGVAHLLVFRRIHQLLGGRVRYLASGGAPLSPEIAEFFHAVGLLILEGYGLTETTPVLTVNKPDAFRFGSVGRPLSGVEVRIAGDGEILARGPNIALGYHGRPQETAEAWDAEGWFHTGDIGTFDDDGFLRITDRKKDLIKTSGGKYVAPQKIENALKSQPHVSQAVVIGDGRKYCVALITLDGEAVRSWAATRSLPVDTDKELGQQPEVVELISREVEEVNRRLASFESIKHFRILPGDFSVEGGELTPSLKIKRKVVAERYRSVIDGLYVD